MLDSLWGHKLQSQKVFKEEKALYNLASILKTFPLALPFPIISKIQFSAYHLI